MHCLRRRASWRDPRTLLVVLVALLLAACTTTDEQSADDDPVPPDGDEATPSDDDPDAVSGTDGFPVVVDGVEIPQRPERIVSLSASLSEILFAIDAGGQVVAADEYSNHPDEAPTTELSGFQPNIEAISSFDPDLVVVSDDPGEVIASLEALGIPTLLLPSAVDLDDVYSQIDRLGTATGNPDAADALVEDMRAEIDGILADVALPDEPLTYFHELTPDFHSVSSETFIGAIYGLLGMTSIADEVGEAGGRYPQLSPEYIIEADPDVILLADAQCCDVTAGDVAERPGWDTITAVRTGTIVELDEDIASRWGPRIVELLRDVAEALDAHEAA